MKQKTLFYCTECGNEMPKWAGRCPACGAWNTIVEQPAEKAASKSSRARAAAPGTIRRACPVTELDSDEEIRFPTGMGELDRVLGGGAVKGSLVLVGVVLQTGGFRLIGQESALHQHSRRLGIFHEIHG